MLSSIAFNPKFAILAGLITLGGLNFHGAPLAATLVPEDEAIFAIQQYNGDYQYVTADHEEVACDGDVNVYLINRSDSKFKYVVASREAVCEGNWKKI